MDIRQTKLLNHKIIASVFKLHGVPHLAEKGPWTEGPWVHLTPQVSPHAFRLLVTSLLSPPLIPGILATSPQAPLPAQVPTRYLERCEESSWERGKQIRSLKAALLSFLIPGKTAWQKTPFVRAWCSRGWPCEGRAVWAPGTPGADVPFGHVCASSAEVHVLWTWEFAYHQGDQK